MDSVAQAIDFNQTPNTGNPKTESQRYTAKRVSREENSPDFHLRSLNNS